MQLTVKGKQLDVGDALRSHIESQLTSVVEKYFSRPIEASVVVSKDAHLYRSDMIVHVGRNIHLNATAEADAPYPACDAAIDRIGKRLRRYKRRLKDHNRDAGSAGEILAAASYVLEAEPEETTENYAEPDQPMVIAEMRTPIETLTVTQAVMRLDLGDLPALMFHNSAHGGLNMIYRRKDGNIGWLDPQDSSTATP